MQVRPYVTTRLSITLMHEEPYVTTRLSITLMHAQPYVLLNDVLVENLFYKFYTCKVFLQYVLSNDVLRRQN